MDDRENVELELYLARHGETTSNAGQPSEETRPGDPELTEKGFLQAKLLGKYYADVRFDRIFSSGMTRALQTAGEVIKLRPEEERILEVSPLFTECGVGEDSGFKSFDEIKARFPFAVPALGVDPEDNFIHAKGPEDDEKRMLRATAALNYIRSRFHNGESVMLVAHGAFNTVLLFAALGLSTNVIFDFAINNSGVSKLVFFKLGTGPFDADVHLIFHNDHSHLAGFFDRELIETMK